MDDLWTYEVLNTRHRLVQRSPNLKLCTKFFVNVVLLVMIWNVMLTVYFKALLYSLRKLKGITGNSIRETGISAGIQIG